MKYLTLLRHAKSSWTDLAIDDFERPLAPRGQQAAPAMGRYLAGFSDRQECPPPIDLIFCSPAKRAAQTLQAVLVELSQRPTVEWQDRLYLASTGKLLQILHEAPDSATHLLMIGHNPGFHELAVKLSQPDTGAPYKALHQKFPTAAAATWRFAVKSWRDIKPARGQLLAFERPKHPQPQ